jgi:hypothetical protein
MRDFVDAAVQTIGYFLLTAAVVWAALQYAGG